MHVPIGAHPICLYSELFPRSLREPPEFPPNSARTRVGPDSLTIGPIGLPTEWHPIRARVECTARWTIARLGWVTDGYLVTTPAIGQATEREGASLPRCGREPPYPQRGTWRRWGSAEAPQEPGIPNNRWELYRHRRSNRPPDPGSMRAVTKRTDGTSSGRWRTLAGCRSSGD